jgi:hypothetical protein
MTNRIVIARSAATKQSRRNRLPTATGSEDEA